MKTYCIGLGGIREVLVQSCSNSKWTSDENDACHPNRHRERSVPVDGPRRSDEACCSSVETVPGRPKVSADGPCALTQGVGGFPKGGVGALFLITAHVFEKVLKKR